MSENEFENRISVLENEDANLKQKMERAEKSAENSSITDEDDNLPDETSWRTTDSAVESPTDSAFDDAESKNQNENIKTDSPGLKPDIGK